MLMVGEKMDSVIITEVDLETVLSKVSEWDLEP